MIISQQISKIHEFFLTLFFIWLDKFMIITPKIVKILTSFVAICWSIAPFSKCIFYTHNWLILQKWQNSQLFKNCCWNINSFCRWYVLNKQQSSKSYYFIQKQQNPYLIVEAWTSPWKIGKNSWFCTTNCRCINFLLFRRKLVKFASNCQNDFFLVTNIF